MLPVRFCPRENALPNFDGFNPFAGALQALFGGIRYLTLVEKLDMCAENVRMYKKKFTANS